MTSEEQYVKCMDAAYAAADRETWLKMMRKVEVVLRCQCNAQALSDISLNKVLAGKEPNPISTLT